jgi:hypothetical protein
MRGENRLEDELFLASDKDQIVKALAIRVNCKLEDLHIYINGVDITKTVVLEEVRIIAGKKDT